MPMPPTGSMGVMGGPAAPPQPHPPPQWSSFSQPHAQHQQQQQPGAGFGGMGGGAPFNPASIAEMANNPMAQLGMRYGREMVQTSLQRYMPGASGAWNAMRYYFHINNSYVKNKLRVRVLLHSPPPPLATTAVAATAAARCPQSLHKSKLQLVGVRAYPTLSPAPPRSRAELPAETAIPVRVAQLCARAGRRGQPHGRGRPWRRRQRR